MPCFNEEENMKPMYERLSQVAKNTSRYVYEFIFIDNGSTDSTASVIEKLAKKDRRVCGVFLSRNFGPEASTIAGLDFASGDAMVMVACDMQDPPELIIEFIKWFESGYDVVLGSYKNKQDTAVMIFLRRMFYRIFQFVSSIDVPVNNTGFGLMSRRVVNAMRQMPETYLFFRGVRAWVGFKTKYVSYVQDVRIHGASSYNMYRYFRFAERSLLALSALPLDITMNLAMFVGILCFPLGFVFLFRVQGIFTVLLWLIGLLFMTMSMVGKYMQVVFEETKRRPVYVVKNLMNIKK